MSVSQLSQELENASLHEPFDWIAFSARVNAEPTPSEAPATSAQDPYRSAKVISKVSLDGWVPERGARVELCAGARVRGCELVHSQARANARKLPSVRFGIAAATRCGHREA